jgi:hypothetical protein
LEDFEGSLIESNISSRYLPVALSEAFVVVAVAELPLLEVVENGHHVHLFYHIDALIDSLYVFC